MDQVHDMSQLMTIDDCWNRIGVWSRQQSNCPELKQVIHCRNCRKYAAAGRNMLKRPVPADYAAEWTERFSAPKESRDAELNSALVFRLGDEWLGLASRYINEITPIRTIHSLPHRTNELVKGLVNIRGELKICVSLGALLQLERARESYVIDHEIHERMIHVTKDDHSFVFPVSEVHGVRNYDDSSLKATPATVAKSRHTFTSGILPWNDRHIGVLDVELVFFALAKGLQ